jgi:hypothetical protein
LPRTIRNRSLPEYRQPERLDRTKRKQPGTASPARDLPALAGAAEDRGLLRIAARLRKRATGLGDTTEAAALIRSCHSLKPHSPDPNPAQWAAAHLSLDDADDVAWLLDALREAGAEKQAAELGGRAAAQISIDDPYAVARSLDGLREAGADEQAAALIARDPAALPSAHITAGDCRSAAFLPKTAPNA